MADMKELRIKRPYGESNVEIAARAKQLGGFFRSYGNYRSERTYIDTYVVPAHITEAMLKGETQIESASQRFIGRQCRVASYGFGKVIDVKPNDPGFPGVWVLVDFGDGSRHEPSWFLSTINIEFFTEGVDSMAKIDYRDQEMMEPLDLNALAQVLPEEDEPEVSEDRLERQAQAHIEAAAQHRDDPLF